MDNFHHHLLRFHRKKHILSEGFSLNVVSESFCNFIVYVGIKKSFTHIFQSFSHVDFSNFTLTFKDFKRTLKAFAQ